MIDSIKQFIESVNGDLSDWGADTKPWFRGESDCEPALCPRISKYHYSEENHLLQSFRRQAGGLANVPQRDATDLWLFLAQHYRVPTRLLDWTVGALHAVYFAINRGKPNPRIYMLNPRKLNDLAGIITNAPNYPLSWVKGGSYYVALAWQNRDLDRYQQQQVKQTGIDLEVPLAFPATYQDQRMIAQRSCFTIHGSILNPIKDILTGKSVGIEDYLIEYRINGAAGNDLLRELSILGVSGATVFPDLEHLADDLVSDIKIFGFRRPEETETGGTGPAS